MAVCRHQVRRGQPLSESYDLDHALTRSLIKARLSLRVLGGARSTDPLSLQLPNMTITYLRSDLGPLTTIFTPPVDCTSLQFIEWDALVQNVAVSRYCYESLFWDGPRGSVIKSCFPEGFASLYNARTADDDYRIGVYSPASICPSGYTVACVHSRIKGQSNPFANRKIVSADSAIWNLLRDGETATGCCPM